MVWAGFDVQHWVRDRPWIAVRLMYWSVPAFLFMYRRWRVRAGMRGLDLLISGHPEEAEKCFRKELTRSCSIERVQALVCLGDALMDQRRYAESKACLEEALQLGDPTGSGQGSMADVLLAMRSDPQRAMEMAEEGLRLSTGKKEQNIYFGGNVSDDLKRARYWARSAGALMLMGRNSEAQQAVVQALTLATAARVAASKTKAKTPVLTRLIVGDRISRARALQMSATHWKIGIALLAIGDNARAAECFRIAQSTDKAGKYRKWAGRELDAMEKGIVSPALGWG